MNAETPGGGTPRASGKGVDFAADAPEIAPTPHQVQIARLRARFDLSPSLASAISNLAFPVLDDWRMRA